MKLSYFVAAHADNYEPFNQRAKRKKDLVAMLKELPEWAKGDYGPIVRIDVYYDDAFDLVDQYLYAGGVEDKAYEALEAAREL